MNQSSPIRDLTEAGVFADIDLHFSEFLETLGADAAVALAAATASAMHRTGHACLELGQAGEPVLDLVDQPLALPEDDERTEHLRAIRLASPEELEGALRDSPVVLTPGDPRTDHDGLPLVFDDGRLYLHRLHTAECRVAERFRELARNVNTGPDVRAAVERAFTGTDERTEEAAAAVLAAAGSRLSIVTGGPGTGKTTLVARILSALVDGGSAEPRRIALAAPTGKAAARLRDSVQGRLSADDVLMRVPALAEFPVEARTIHRLLASRTSLINRLQALIVDECSMVDLPLMARLVGALPEECRLILLGDANQLSSVEPGSVFSDLCNAGSGARLEGCVSRLTRNYRFSPASGIGRLAATVVDGDGEGALAVLRDRHDPETTVENLDHEAAFASLARSVAGEWADHMADLEANPEAVEAFPERRVLCSHRRGPFGTNRFNHLVERRLRELRRRTGHDAWYVGRPIIVTQNDRQTDLVNGDAGVVVPGPEGGRRIWFPERDRGDERFLVSPARLPRHESYFALTVHRAQGSEYKHVVFIPGPAASRVNTRELFYTAVTRASDRVTVMASEESVRAAAERLTSRATGLLDRLR